MDNGRASKACWNERILRTAPDWLSAKELLKSRWLCASGIYHSAGNTLSIAGFKAVTEVGLTVQEFMCKEHRATWGDDDGWFMRCNAGLGMAEAEFKLWQVGNGDCPDPMDGQGKLLPLSAWELQQLTTPTIQQRSCNPKAFFGQANAVRGVRARVSCSP